MVPFPYVNPALQFPQLPTAISKEEIIATMGPALAHMVAYLLDNNRVLEKDL